MIKKFEEFVNESEIKNRQEYGSAVEKMSVALYDEFVDEDEFSKISDLGMCSDDDILMFVNMRNSSGKYSKPLISSDELDEMESFSLKDIIEVKRIENKGWSYIDAMDEFIDDNLDSVLNEDEYETVYDDIDAEGIIHKTSYGGGSFESKADFRNMCKRRMVGLIRERFQN